MKILVMGLPSSGKTYISRILANGLDCHHYDADIVRAVSKDWDFSEQGRINQAQRMAELAYPHWEKGENVICSFVAPTEKIRRIFKPDYLIYCDRPLTRNYEDTNELFEPPKFYDTIYNDNEELVKSVVLRDLARAKK